MVGRMAPQNAHVLMLKCVHFAGVIIVSILRDYRGLSRKTKYNHKDPCKRKAELKLGLKEVRTEAETGGIQP